MKQNDKIENNISPPEQNSGANSRTETASVPAGPSTDHAPRTTECPHSINPSIQQSNNPQSADSSVRQFSNPADPCHSSNNPSIPSLARRRRAPYRHRNHRRTGKVARLPAAIRHEICLRFTRYEEYKDIIAGLASQGHPNIRECNLSRWRKGGFQDWLRREQDMRLDLITMAFEVLEELVKQEKGVGSRESVADSSTGTASAPLSQPPAPTDNGPLAADSSRSKNPSIQQSISPRTLNN